ncbi:PucR family transcriptional regulator [Nocardia sp. NPDC058499]|uniref:PucR family transcriptional regulator n=1 Tax=Nocardia sp. NPDC058499 TaxID=3346530 RepID=UPI00364F7EFC
MTVSADLHPTAVIGPRPGGSARADSADGPDPRPGTAELADCRTSVIQACHRVLTSEAANLPYSTPAPELVRLHDSAAHWIRRGGTAEAFHRVVRAAVDERFADLLADAQTGSASELLPAIRRFVRAHEAVARAVSTGLTGRLPNGADAPAPALRSLATAAAQGNIEALPPGARISETYAVLALTPHTAGRTDSNCAAGDATFQGSGAYGAVYRMRPVLSRDPSILTALGVHGGTLLVPADSADPTELVADLAAAAGVPLLAITVPAPRTGIAAVADTAHELLDLARRLQYGPGLYRFGDLALEYQLTRPGPARTRLAARVSRLYDHPELLDTLLLYIRNRLRRQTTAQMLELHRNTVDYRLRRIQELTGCDPVQQTGLWNLQSALVAHSYEYDSAVPAAGPPAASPCAVSTTAASGRPGAGSPREDSPTAR